jgi:hypothetical protein
VELEAGLQRPEELRVPEGVFCKRKDGTATALGKMSHEERGYTETQLCGPIPCEYAMTLRAIKWTPSRVPTP